MRAVMMLVLARRTSMTRTEMPASGIAPAALAVRATSMRTRSAPVVAQSEDLQAQGVQDGAAGRLVDAARLHPHVAVLDEIHAADAVLAPQTVEALEQRHRWEDLAVDGHRIAGLEVDQHLERDVGRRFGGIRELEHLVGGRRPRVLQDPSP